MRRLALLLGLIATVLIAPASAQNRLDEILERGSLRVATTGDYPPFSYRDPASGEYRGIDIDLAGELARALGVKLELVATSWPTLMRDLGGDKIDIVMSGVSANLERQKRALFSVPYLKDGKTPITRCENQGRFQTMDQIDRPGVTLIVNPGGTNERFARDAIKNATITVHPDNGTIFDQIVDGRADVMITDAVEARLQQKLHPQLCAVHPDAPFDYSEKAYLLPRDWLFKAFVDLWLHQTMESGKLRKIHDKWLDYPWPKG